MTAPKPVPCSIKWRGLWPPSRAMALTTRTVFTPASPTPPRGGRCRAAARDRRAGQTAESEPTLRDRHLQHIADHGRMARQRASGYTKRAPGQAAMGRWKRVIGDRLRAHTEERRATEVDVAVYVLDRCRNWGARSTSASPDPGRGSGRCGPPMIRAPC